MGFSIGSVSFVYPYVFYVYPDVSLVYPLKSSPLRDTQGIRWDTRKIQQGYMYLPRTKFGNVSLPDTFRDTERYMMDTNKIRKDTVQIPFYTGYTGIHWDTFRIHTDTSRYAQGYVYLPYLPPHASSGIVCVSQTYPKRILHVS